MGIGLTWRYVQDTMTTIEPLGIKCYFVQRRWFEQIPTREADGCRHGKEKC